MSQKYHWQYHPKHKISLFQDDEILTTYNFSNVDAAKPFMHPVNTSNGVPLTAYQPSDHVWHRGLWFAWKYINGVNFWEEEPIQEDSQTRSLSEGRTVVVSDETVTFGAEHAEITTWIDYVSLGGERVMQERRLVRICLPQSYGDYTIDWEQEFTVGGEALTLSATPVAKQTPWGGYAGFGWRAARSLRDFRILNSEGVTGDKANGEKARWVDLSGVADGSKNLAAGLAILDHPDNPRHPAPYYVFFDTAQFGYINPSFVLHEPLELAAGERLNLNYRAVVHDGWPVQDFIEREFRAFSSAR